MWETKHAAEAKKASEGAAAALGALPHEEWLLFCTVVLESGELFVLQSPASRSSIDILLAVLIYCVC